MRLAADWILPGVGAPIERGVVEILGQTIARVAPRSEFTDGDFDDLGSAVILPGLINAHTHLELGHLAGLGPESADLPAWLEAVIMAQRAMGSHKLAREAASAVSRGAGSCLDAGVTTVGDISGMCQISRTVLRAGPLRAVSFGEVLGIGPGRGLIEGRLEAAADRSLESPYLTVALAPHAPYSIETAGLQTVVRRARQEGLRLSMHLAESVEELQFLQTGDGPLRRLLEHIGASDEHLTVPGQSPVRWADEQGLLDTDCLIAHGNYLDDSDIARICARGASVAYCPRTHARFRHARYPLLELLGSGVNVCVGTDSLASNPSLEILAELREIRRIFCELSFDALLRMATINAARALGVARCVGSLERGKLADLAVFALDAESAPFEDQLLDEHPRLMRLYVGGQQVR